MDFIIALIGTATAVITVSLTNYFSKKNQRKFEERKLKEAYYTEFINAISFSVVSNHSNESRNNLADCINRLFLVSSPDVIRKLQTFSAYLISSSGDQFSEKQHDQLLTDLIKAIRVDMFSTKRANKGYPIVHLVSKKVATNKKE